MDDNQVGSPGSDASDSSRGVVVTERPVVTRTSSSVNDALAPLAPVTAQLDNALTPLQSATAPLQGMLAPLEGIGKQIVAYIGAALLFIGVFLTVRTISLGIFSYSQNLWDAYGWAGVLVLLSAIVGAAAAALRMWSWLWLAAIVSLVALVIPFLSVLFDSNWGLGWGWIVLIVGWLAFAAAAVMRENRIAL